jgi:hypothetical protein
MEGIEVYFLGKQAALIHLLELAEDGSDFDGLMQSVNETVEAPLEKSASAEDAQYWMGVESICYSFLKEAAQYYGEYDVEDEDVAMLDVLDRVTDDFAAFEKKALSMPGRGEIAAAKHSSGRMKSLLGRAEAATTMRRKAQTAGLRGKLISNIAGGKAKDIAKSKAFLGGLAKKRAG